MPSLEKIGELWASRLSTKKIADALGIDESIIHNNLQAAKDLRLKKFGRPCAACGRIALTELCTFCR